MKTSLHLGRMLVLTVTLTAILGNLGCPRNISVPNVTGLTEAAAQSALTAAGLSLGGVTRIFSDTVANGSVISQSPVSGTSVPTDSQVSLVVSKGPEPILVPNVVGQTQAAAEAAIVAAGFVVGTVTEEFSGSVAAGNVIGQNPADGSSAAAGTSIALVVSKGIVVTVTGHIEYDNDAPLPAAAEVTASVRAEELASLLRAALREEAAMQDWKSTGAETAPDALHNFPALLSKLLVPKQTDPVLTDGNGNFILEIVVPELPSEILVEVDFDADPLPVLHNAKWNTAESDALNVGDITLPNPQGAEVPLTEGGGQTADGSVRVQNLPGNVDTLFARAYDPDATPEAFPGEFAEMGAIPLNSSVFVWMEALDAEGNPVHELSQAARVRSRIPESQWIDLEDINAGTDRIEIPIYTYDETLNVWEQESVGWLEDAAGTVLPEDAQSVILDGSFAGDIYAAFNTSHFSYMNVDYAYIGPWTLSRIDRAKRNNDCLFKAMQLASKIAKSAAGHTAYARVNKPDVNLDTELGDSMGPELKDDPIPGDYGLYEGDSGGSETQFKISSKIWDGCGEGATDAQKKNATLLMAVTILHETAHWKDDVKKNPDDDTDTEGEEGNQLEKDIFGGIISEKDGVVKRDGTAVDDATRDGWLDPATWPPAPVVPPGGGKMQVANAAGTPKGSSLTVDIRIPKTTFELGEEIPVEVTYTNISSAPVLVMNKVALEGWPLHFNIVKEGSDSRVRFLGPELKRELPDDLFDTLNPNETLVQTVNLLNDPISGAPRYQLLESGNFEITAIYEAFQGVEESASNTLNITILIGGSISGNLTSAENGAALNGAIVRVFDGNFLLTRATAGTDGAYTIPELPAGTYTLEAQASGFLRSRKEGVEVRACENTTASFSLSPLLALGQLRVVLTWGASPSDLDSHLWLPLEEPYHLYYSRKGNLEACPFALLDIDDTGGFGPETITIGQRFLNGSYLYAVRNFSGTPSITGSGAQVNVFDATGLIATFDVPTEGEGAYWSVFSISGATGALTEINTLATAEPAPYPDTDTGCIEVPEK